MNDDKRRDLIETFKYLNSSFATIPEVHASLPRDEMLYRMERRINIVKQMINIGRIITDGAASQHIDAMVEQRNIMIYNYYFVRDMIK